VPLKSSMIGVSAVGLMTAALLVVDRHFTHPQIVEHLAFGYMLPIAAVAMLFGSTAGTVATAVSALAAAFFLFPPKFSFWIDNPFQLAELFWLAVLGYISRVGLREGYCEAELGLHCGRRPGGQTGDSGGSGTSALCPHN